MGQYKNGYPSARYDSLVNPGPIKGTILSSVVKDPVSLNNELTIGIETERWCNGACNCGCKYCLYNNTNIRKLMRVTKKTDKDITVASDEMIDKTIAAAFNTIFFSRVQEGVSPGVIRFHINEKCESAFLRRPEGFIRLIKGLRDIKEIYPSRVEFMITTKRYDILRKSPIAKVLNNDCIICITLSDPCLEENTPTLDERVGHGSQVLKDGLRLRYRTTVVRGVNEFAMLIHYVKKVSKISERVFVSPVSFMYVPEGHKKDIKKELGGDSFLSKNGTSLDEKEWQLICLYLITLHGVGYKNIIAENLGLKSSRTKAQKYSFIENYKYCKWLESINIKTKCKNNLSKKCYGKTREGCENHKRYLRHNEINQGIITKASVAQ